MKLLRFGPAGSEKPGLLDASGTIRDLSAVVSDFTAATLSFALLDRLRAIDPASLPAVPADVRLGAPLLPANLLCIGLNYKAHALEAGMALPSEPVVFSKHTSALSGPFDPVRIPPGSTKTDWEVELAVVIGRRTLHVSEQDALSCVAGYTICNDVSERDYQIERGGQWIKAKSYPGFCPLGPVLVTADDVPDPQALRLWLSVNGEMKQDSSTADMLFPIAEIISYLSQFMELLPGDLITTGTPPGVGLGKGVYLQRGDVMRLGIDGLGEMEQTTV
ncbi:fumarylacetoacetate hydrolase family protein [Insolitispirillum peregrinum]|uniref:fumarylacetoacetate hydrolase family protein n=1 Tax=Insolitispirillum peregrinum TaxID=80876 RepID=UPI00361CABEB